MRSGASYKGTGDVLIPLFFHAIQQSNTAVLVVFFRVLLFVESLQLLEIILRRMILLEEEPCFILVVLFNKRIGVCQISIWINAITSRLSIITLFEGSSGFGGGTCYSASSERKLLLHKLMRIVVLLS
jgi:hypothetical protein